MLAPDLYRQLQPFTQLTNKHAISPSYRALMLSPGQVRGCAPYGAMRSLVDLDPDAEACIDAADFLQTLRSLPKAEFHTEVRKGALHWACGPARGHLALLSDSRHAIDIPLPIFNGVVSDLIVGAEFATGLDLGMAACSMTAAARAFGLQGVQIHNEHDRAYAYSSDNTVLAGCCLGRAIAGDGTVITLHPEAAALLAQLVARDGEAALAVDDQSLYVATDTTEFLIYRLTALRTNLAETLAKYAAAERRLPLFKDAVAAFLRRAGALAEAGQNSALVEVTVDGGRVGLRFAEADASTEEYYVVEGGPKLTAPPIRLEAGRLVKAIEHADEMVFDHVATSDGGALILRGRQEFRFGVWGRAE